MTDQPRVVRVRYTALCFDWGSPTEVVGPFPDEEAAGEFVERMNERAEGDISGLGIHWMVGLITPPEHFKDYVDG